MRLHEERGKATSEVENALSMSLNSNTSMLVATLVAGAPIWREEAGGQEEKVEGPAQGGQEHPEELQDVQVLDEGEAGGRAKFCEE